MVESFDYIRINDLAEQAIPNGKYECLVCKKKASALQASHRELVDALHRAVTEMEFWSKGHSDAEIAIARAALAQAEGAVVHMVPHSTSDVCWCQPFDGPKHPKCPMHGDK
jgi:hypothetical protein